MPRLTYFAGVALVVLAGAFLLADELTWQPGVTERNVRRIRPGMTKAQVVAVLGEPDTGWWLWWPETGTLGGCVLAITGDEGVYGVWETGPSAVHIHFDAADRVQTIAATRRPVTAPPSLAPLRSWLRPGGGTEAPAE